MGDPVSTALMMEAAPEVTGAMGLGELSGAGAIVNPFTSAMTTGMTAGGYGAGGESLFGFDPSISGFGQGIYETVKQNPMQTLQALNATKQLLSTPQVHVSGGSGQISRGQIPQMDYSSLLNPQQNTVLRPQAMSLL